MAHYYRTDGTAAHFEGPNGRGTSLREARKLDLYPSVTTINQIVSKPALTNWLQEQAALEALRCDTATLIESLRDEQENDLAKRMVARAREKTFAKADEGTAIHDLLETWFRAPNVTHVMHPDEVRLCLSVNDLLIEHCGDHDWIPERSFCDTEYGFAGKCDLHNNLWIIDFKTKDGPVDGARGYPDQAEQLAAYAHGLGFPAARTANVFISRDRELWGTEQGACFYEHKDDNAWNRFYYTLQLWQVKNKFGPAWDALQEAA